MASATEELSLGILFYFNLNFNSLTWLVASNGECIPHPQAIFLFFIMSHQDLRIYRFSYSWVFPLHQFSPQLLPVYRGSSPTVLSKSLGTPFARTRFSFPLTQPCLIIFVALIPTQNGLVHLFVFLFIVMLKDNLRIFLHIIAQVGRCLKICNWRCGCPDWTHRQNHASSAFHRKLLFKKLLDKLLIYKRNR